MRIVGNYIHGQYGLTCGGVVIVGHGMFDGLTVADNIIDIDPAATTGGCYGIAFGNGGTTNPAYLRHAVFSGNTIRNGGSISLMVSNCPDCVIENNLVMQDWSPEGYPYPTTGIAAPAEATRAGMDDMGDRNLIRNNTIWFGPKHTHGALGIKVGTEGTGHVVANNTVYYSSPSTVDTWGGVNCFGYPLPPPSYASINNNHCHSNAPYKWEAAHGPLAAWQSYSGSDTASLTGDPLFTQAGAAFTPLPGSPLVGAGSAADGAVYDLAGKLRPNPPSIGAYEP